MAAEDGTGWTLNARRQTLAAQALRASAADKRIAELECELDQAREQLTHQQNRAASLETSLALKADENSQLSGQISELSAALKRERDLLERAHLAVATVEAERIALEKSCAAKSDENARLSHRVTELAADLQLRHEQLERARLASAAADSERVKRDEQHQADTAARDHKIGLVSARADNTERSLEQIREQLRTSENEIERLRKAQVESSAELARRATALASAEHTITALGNLFWQLESAVRRQWQEPQKPDATTQGIVAECSRAGSLTSGILERDLGKDAWLFESLLNRSV